MVRLLAFLFCGAICGCAQSSDSVRRFARLTNQEWTAVQRGEVIAKTLETNQKRELAVAGVARIQVSRGCFLEKFRDIETFKKSPLVLQIGKFSTPVNARNLARLTLDAKDANALRDCEVGSCSVKVPLKVVLRLANRAESLGMAYSMVANSVFREELVSYIQRYFSEGDPALIEYRNKDNPVRLSAEFHSMLTGWAELNELAPEFCDFLIQSPQQVLPKVEEFLYWSKESFGLKPVISVTHVSIDQLPDQAWIASKQIYSRHYYDTSLAITLVADDPTELARGSSIYLAYVNRSRIDLLGGIFGAFKRHLVRGRLEDGMRKNLRETVTKLESSCESGTSVSQIGRQ